MTMSREEAFAHQQTLDAIAAAATARAKAFRDELATQMRAEFDAHGSVATWRIGEVGQVIGKMSRARVVVDDVAQFTAWVGKHRPDEVVSKPTVRPAYEKALLAAVELADDQIIDPTTGEVVPGLTQLPGGAYLGVDLRANSDAKQRAIAAADAALDQLGLPAITQGAAA